MKRSERERMRKFLAGCAVVGVGAWLVFRNQTNQSGSTLAAKLRAGGGLDSLKGRAKDAAGRAFGSGSLSGEGLLDQAVGAVKAGLGKAVSAVDGAAR